MKSEILKEAILSLERISLYTQKTETIENFMVNELYEKLTKGSAAFRLRFDIDAIANRTIQSEICNPVNNIMLAIAQMLYCDVGGERSCD